MNKVILKGRLTKDVDLSFTGKGKDKLAIARLTVAVDRGDKDKNTDFIQCTAFGSTAEFLSEYFAKGKEVLIEGRWETGSYENKDGDTVYTNTCIISKVEFCGSRKD